MASFFRPVIALAVAFGLVGTVPAAPEDDRAAIDRDLKELETKLSARKGDALFADADIFRKGVEWALRYEPKLEPADIALIQKALRRGLERTAADKPTWPTRKGKLVRGYRSTVDDSTQPY